MLHKVEKSDVLMLETVHYYRNLYDLNPCDFYFLFFIFVMSGYLKVVGVQRFY